MVRTFLLYFMNTHIHSLRVLAACLAIVVGVPLVTGAIVSARESTMQKAALENKTEVRAQRRTLTRLNALCENATEDTKDLSCKAYLIVQKECTARQSIRVWTGCPEINDLVRIEEVRVSLVRGDTVPAPVASSSSSSSVQSAVAVEASWADLTGSEQLYLRRLIRLETCSEKLPAAMYMLCMEAVGGNGHAAAPTGLGNDLEGVRATRDANGAKTLMDRIEMTVPRTK